jgi:hypothetical protein
MREERRLRVFETSVLRRIFGPKRDQVTGEWAKLHNEEFNDMYFSPVVILVNKWRRTRWAGHVARMGESRGATRVLVGKSEQKKAILRRTVNRKWHDCKTANRKWHDCKTNDDILSELKINPFVKYSSKSQD